MKLTYKDIKKMNPETMTWEDIKNVNEYTARINKQTFKIQIVTIIFQLLALLINAYTYFFV